MKNKRVGALNSYSRCNHSHTLEKMAVTTQPRTNRKEAENFVKELDPEIVQG